MTDNGYPHPAPGPLVVAPTNPRYFAVAGDPDGRAVYLTGSHIYQTLQDGVGPGEACGDGIEPIDFDGYLRFLEERGHTFIRLWRWEQFRSYTAMANYHLCMEPQPWPRTGSGEAIDGEPRYDLDRFDDSYFARLRERVVAAGERGMYVGVMLFEGWGLHLSSSPLHVEGHPFHERNNVNGVGIGSILDYQVLPLEPRVQALQDAYIRHVIDTVHDQPNVLWEVANESSGGGKVDLEFAGFLGLDTVPEWGDSTEWQYWVIDTVKRHESEMGYDPHPIGMTMQFPVPDQSKVNAPLYASRAEWISPGFEEPDFVPGNPERPTAWFADPPPGDGRKVVIADTDHIAPGGGDALWAWKTFLRGHHPILMDFGIIDGVDPPDPKAGGPMSFNTFEPARFAMGDTARYATRMGLLAMEPREDLASTRFALANPGVEYLILQPAGGVAFTATLEPGTYDAEWFGVDNRQQLEGGAVSADGVNVVTFEPPFTDGPSVLYIRRA